MHIIAQRNCLMKIKIGTIQTLKNETKLYYGNGYSIRITSQKQKDKNLAKASKFATKSFFELNQLVNNVTELSHRNLFFSHQMTEMITSVTNKLDYISKHKNNNFPNFSNYYFGGCLFILSSLKSMVCILKDLLRIPRIATNIWGCNMLMERIIFLESKYLNFGFDQSDSYTKENMLQYAHDNTGIINMSVAR